ncbi:TPA: hypothetical protein ACHVGM_000604 [Streptococcus suis]
MLDAPPNRYHCISKAPQRLLGAIFFAESFFSFSKGFRPKLFSNLTELKIKKAQFLGLLTCINSDKIL